MSAWCHIFHSVSDQHDKSIPLVTYHLSHQVVIWWVFSLVVATSLGFLWPFWPFLAKFGYQGQLKRSVLPGEISQLALIPVSEVEFKFKSEFSFKCAFKFKLISQRKTCLCGDTCRCSGFLNDIFTIHPVSPFCYLIKHICQTCLTSIKQL